VPGYGFSGPTAETGWNLPRIARAWAELMSRLGYERYGAQGGDWGSGISRHLGIAAPDHVVGVHVNTLQLPSELDSVLSAPGPLAGTIGLAGMTPGERVRLEAGARFLQDGAGYGMLQSTRPQTLSYALTHSPVEQLAWISEKFWEWSDPACRPDRDRVLTNVMLYWLTRTAGSSARLYRETALARRKDAPPRLTVPTGVAVFPHDIGLPTRRLAERESNILH
jgi:epoxide hydrolase